MADVKPAKATAAKAEGANTALQHGDHDRVSMLSLKADGTPDQLNPEIIGDKEFAIEATKRQFTEQAVSAVDQAERGVSSDDAETVEQDPSIKDLTEKHDAAAKAAEGAAESAVGALFTKDEGLSTGTATTK